MKCLRCQHENPPAQKFCGECGTRLVAVCPSCKHENPLGQNFCGECGTTLAGVLPPKVVSPEQYTPKHLAERILNSRSAMEGERKQVTVLFADLKGSMELLADRDPEHARKILDPVLERMMEAVHRYEGTVNQVMGDGIMALFGAPLTLEDHAVRACYAALRMQQAITRYADELRRTQALDVQIRVGINSGEVVVRSVGSDLRMDYTAVGQTTHLAARMEQLARPGTTLLSSHTLKLAEGYVQVRPLGAMPIKGMAEAIEVFELAGAGSARTRLQAAVTRGLTRFVGRQRELDVLADALSNAGRGKGQALAIVGEPGVGKSRLFWEFLRSHRTQGWLTVEAGSVSYGKATPYLPVIDLLKAYFKIGERDDARSIREKVTGKLLTLDRRLETLLSPLLALLDQPVEDAQWRQLDPTQRRRRTLEALERLWLQEAQTQPLILVFEDLHWIDTETQEFLDRLVEKIPTNPILLLFNYRPEYRHPWGGKTYYTQLRLDPLSAESAEELLTSLLGSDAGVQPLKLLLIERTEGNPFFLEESVRTLVEVGALGGERGNYQLLRPAASSEVPATVQAILAARIDRLSADDKRLLQTAAVIGKDVPYPLLQAIEEMSEDALQRCLSRLQAAEFLYETSLFPDLEYTFKHALTHEVAYGGLLHDRRSTLHRRILETIEQMHAERLDEHIERLAHHAHRAELWNKAAMYLHKAAERALARFASREAVAAADQAVVALSHLPETPEILERAIDVRLVARLPLVQLNEQVRLRAIMAEALELARRLGDKNRLGWVLTYLCQGCVNVGRMSESLDYGRQAIELADGLGDAALVAGSNFLLGITYMFAGRYPEAISHHDTCVAAAKKGESLSDLYKGRRLAGLPASLYLPFVQGFAHLFAAMSLAELGRFDQASESAENGVRLTERARVPYLESASATFSGFVHLRRGEVASAIPLLERGLQIAQVSDNLSAEFQASHALGHAYGLSGRFDDAIILLERVLNLGSAPERVWTPLVCVRLGEAYGWAGRMDEGAAMAEKGLAVARGAGERGYEAWGLYVLAGIRAQNSKGVAAAQATYRDALRLAEELGMRPLQAQCLLALGELSAPGVETESAEIAAARDMFQDMRMNFWLEKAAPLLHRGESDGKT